MKKTILLGAVVLTVVPSAALAADSPSPARSQAEKNCRDQRDKVGVTAFKSLYGTNRNGSNAFGKCVSRQTAVVTAIESQSNRNASKECASERTALGEEAFQKKYSTNKNRRHPAGTNGFGKCVSSKAKARSTTANNEQQQRTINAARQCKAERAKDPAAFRAKYGTNRNKSNAFGKCVSRTARAQQQQQQQS